MIAKCGKTSEHKEYYCYGHACLNNLRRKCNHGLGFVRDTSKASPTAICFQDSTEKIAEVLCKELGFPVNADFKPTASKFTG